MAHTIALTSRSMYRADDEWIEVECASVDYEHGSTTSHGNAEPPFLTLGQVDLVTWRLVKAGPWSRVTWDDPVHGRMAGEICGAVVSVGRNVRFTLRDVTPEP